VAKSLVALNKGLDRPSGGMCISSHLPYELTLAGHMFLGLAKTTLGCL
jgi:hypothetical protein